jgi:ribose transport system substrate-binding protein
MPEVLRRVHSYRRRVRITLSVTAALGVAAAVTAGLASTASAVKPTKAAVAKPPYTFVVSNNFLGNDWRPQVEKLAQLTANLPPFKGKVKIKIVNSADTNQAQIADLDSIIQTKPAAIMLIAGSTTALDPTVQKACKAGIEVWTISGPVNAPCAWNVNQDFYGGMEGVGQWMAKVLHGTGSVFVDQGIPGLGTSQDIEGGFLKGLKQYGPKITVSGTFQGQYAPGPEQQGISNLLAGTTKVDGVMTQGYCTPVFNAFQQAGLHAVPATCYGYNGEMETCAQSGHTCSVLSGSPVVMQIAMKDALETLEGKLNLPKSKIIPVPMTLFISATPKVTITPPSGVTVQVLKSGSNFFPDLSAGLALPYTLPQYKISPTVAAG